LGLLRHYLLFLLKTLTSCGCSTTLSICRVSHTRHICCVIMLNVFMRSVVVPFFNYLVAFLHSLKMHPMQGQISGNRTKLVTSVFKIHFSSFRYEFRSLYYKHITIINDNTKVVRMMLQVLASPTIIILTTLEAPTIIILITLEVSFMLLDNIYSTIIP
jgi:hypothetical protein